MGYREERKIELGLWERKKRRETVDIFLMTQTSARLIGLRTVRRKLSTTAT